MQYKRLKIMYRFFCLVIAFCCLSSVCFALEVDNEDYAVIGKRKVFLKIAGTKKEHMQGLMYIKHFPESQGMIFLFPEANKRFFWMKNVNIPLDMIFIRKSKIMSIKQNVPIDLSDNHPTYRSLYKADAVIEVNAGFCEKYNINSGDLIYLSNGVKYKWEEVRNSHNELK